jgi:hypothetical protein
MEGVEKPHMDRHKEVMNDWNYGISCTLTSLLVSDLENSRCLIFCLDFCGLGPASTSVLRYTDTTLIHQFYLPLCSYITHS